MYLPPTEFFHVMSSFFSFDSICFFECVLLFAMKKHKLMAKTKATKETQESRCEKSKQKKMSFDMGVTFPLSKDSEIGKRI